MATAHVNIGSNIGDRHAQIELAVIRIMEVFGNGVRRSRFIESEPWGYDSPNCFINLGLAVEIPQGMRPIEVLRKLRAIEHSINPASHRNADGSYADRVIDIDLIAIDNTILNTPELTLPHPRMHLRPFVLQPIVQLSPSWRHPLLGLTARQLLDSQDA